VNCVLALVADLGAAAGVAVRAGPLSASSRARLAKIHSPRRLAQSALARTLAALATARLLGRPYPAEFVEESAEHAGLELRDAGDLAVSIAHSRERVAVAVGAGPVGIDVEYLDPRRDCLALARHACSPAEVAWLERAAPAELIERFYLLWTLREAAFKAGVRPAVLRGEPCFDPDPAAARFRWDSRQLDNYCVAVATPTPVSIEWLGLDGADLVPLGEPGAQRLDRRGSTAAGCTDRRWATNLQW
jgi:4'-phosphopantetheinyl transferase